MESTISGNISNVKERIAAACERAGRDPKEVTLIAVSKLKPFEDIMEAKNAGATDFGENYVQELVEKIGKNSETCGEATPTVRWHMIGHLQKNKVKYLIGQTALIHSVDSLFLAEQIEKELAKKDEITRILLEVNVAEEESKWGFTTESVKEAAAEIGKLPHVRVLGLMTSAPITEDPESNRVYFRKLNELAHEMLKENLLVKDPSFSCPVLSMGMTGDFEVAVEEGATMVRVGTAIFGKR
ncbi:MAG: YggS family pyridoxal phosphate-dependent enzyme [Lachnospiraceae bacterium]|nr:YggS family pyridoxal phosphate-dependent enzyme [Lachnospiraceae bacterium]